MPLQHHRGARREEDHGAREAAGHARCCGRASPKNWSAPRPTTCAPALFKDVDVVDLHARRRQPRRRLGRRHAATGSCRSSTRSRARARTRRRAVARPVALDAVELMNIGWNFRREHLRIQQRSHYVITNGGDQPNVVPPNASVWYYFRETDYSAHQGDVGDRRQDGARRAALMTDTEVSMRVLGSAWPRHFNKTIAETMYANIEKVGLPTVDRSRPDAGQGAAERAEGAGSRPGDRSCSRCAAAS